MDDMENETPDPVDRDDSGQSAEPEPIVPEPEPEPEPKAARRKATVQPSTLEGTLVLSSLVFQAYSLRSISVLLLQDRLAELGHGDARSDMPGWMSHGTVAALREFQAARGLPVTGEPDRDTVEAVMAGTDVIVA